MNTVDFVFQSNKNKLKKISKMNILQRLKYDVEFKIYINNKLFLQIDSFAVCDFLYYVNNWRINSSEQNMVYNCIETDENPLIQFVKSECYWKIESKWQEYISKELFTKEQILYSINKEMKKNNIRF